MTARSFLWKWNLRVLRNEWRQHVVIFTLIFVGVAFSTGGTLAAFNLVEPPKSEFGNGQFIATTDFPDRMEDSLQSEGQLYGKLESATVQITGSTQRVDARAMDPANPVTNPLLVLLEGDWPTGPGEIAVTDRAIVDRATVGNAIALGDADLTVVGVVENPTRLADEFVLMQSLDGIGLQDSERSSQFYIDAQPDQVGFGGVDSFGIQTSGGVPVRTALTLLVSVVSAMGMLEVALLVGIGFAVIARRRSRQYGLLAAAGATPKLVRLAATYAGTIIGLLGATLGLLAGISLAALVLPAMELAVGHRIDFAVPWWAVIPNSVFAIVVAGVAAGWPARALSKQPVAHMLAALRPQPAPVGKGALAGAVLTGLGGTALAVGFARLNTLLALLGVVLAPVGLLLVSPLLVKVAAQFSAKMPLPYRMASRAIGRHNRRSASVVSALAMALAIPIGVAVVTSSLDTRSIAQGPNLDDDWMIAWQPGVDDPASRIPAQLNSDTLVDAARRIREAAPELTLIPIDSAVTSDERPERWDFRNLGSQLSVEPFLAGRQGSPDCLTCDSYGFGETDSDGNEIAYIVEEAWIASPELLSVLDIDAGWLDSSTPAVARSAEYHLLDSNGVVSPATAAVVSPTWPHNSRIPPLLVSPRIANSERYERVGLGWFAFSDMPISAETRAAVSAAVGPDLLMEFHQQPEPQSGLRRIGLVIGVLVGLGIALSAVGLFTSELAGDLRLLASIGASPRTARQLSAAVAVILAAAGALIALLIGYLPLLPLLAAKESDFPFVIPWFTLLGFLVVFPLLTGTAAWIAGRRPAVLRGPEPT